LTPAGFSSEEELCALARKYEVLAKMRRDRARDGSIAARAELRALAREFPGSLRELDTVPLDEIDRRTQALREAARGATGVDAWMIWMSAYHATMRDALFVKARVARAPALSDDLARAVAETATAHLGHPIDETFVRAVASPPRGRLNAFVFDRLGQGFGVAPELIWQTLFPSRRGSLR
jgi:hypothetical protein